MLTGGAQSSENILYGDAYYMSNSQGGNDLLAGGVGSKANMLYGDASTFDGNTVGGNDILIAGDRSVSVVTTNSLYGDGKDSVTGNVICGNDRLISGTGDDAMWGDIANSDYGAVIDLSRITTGRDVFVFSNNNGTDFIHDFRHGEDKIDLHGIAGVNSFNAITPLEVSGADTVIRFGSNTITVIGVTDLAAADFLFS